MKKKDITFLTIVLFMWLAAGISLGKMIIDIVKIHFTGLEEIQISQGIKNKKFLFNIFSEKRNLIISPADIKIIGILAGIENGAIVFTVKNGPVQIVKNGETSSEGLRFKGFKNKKAIFFSGNKKIEVLHKLDF